MKKYNRFVGFLDMHHDPLKFQVVKYGSFEFFFFSEHIINISLLPNPYVFVDVGASVGQNFRFLMHTVGKKGYPVIKKFYGFEPNRNSFEYLEWWKQKHPWIEIFNVAISGEKSLPEMNFNDYTDTKNDHHIGWGHLDAQESKEYVERIVRDSGAIKQYPVKVVKFNNIFDYVKEERIHYMTIDTEGAEREILADASRKIFDRIDQVCLEIHKPDMMDYYRNVFGRNGFPTVLVYNNAIYASKYFLRDKEEC